MDMVLPKHVRIMWPDGGIATHFLQELRSEGLISDRPLVLVENEPRYYRARRMFFFRSSREWNEGPWITWLTQRLVQQRILPGLASRTSHHPFEEARYRVIVLERPPESSTRRLENHDELMARLREWLPEDEGFTFDTFVPGPAHGNPMWKTAERVYKGCLLIGPHGGNMPNLMFMRPGCWVVEVGFMDESFHLPTDFSCLARNLGLTYWMSIAEGGYGGTLRADMDDIREIVAAYRREVMQ